MDIVELTYMKDGVLQHAAIARFHLELILRALVSLWERAEHRGDRNITWYFVMVCGRPYYTLPPETARELEYHGLVAALGNGRYRVDQAVKEVTLSRIEGAQGHGWTLRKAA